MDTAKSAGPAALQNSYTAPTSRRLNEPKISCFDQFGCNIIGIKTARYNSTRFSKRNVPSSVTGDDALPARL